MGGRNRGDANELPPVDQLPYELIKPALQGVEYFLERQREYQAAHPGRLAVLSPLRHPGHAARSHPCPVASQHEAQTIGDQVVAVVREALSSVAVTRTPAPLRSPSRQLPKA